MSLYKKNYYKYDLLVSCKKYPFKLPQIFDGFSQTIFICEEVTLTALKFLGGLETNKEIFNILLSIADEQVSTG